MRRVATAARYRLISDFEMRPALPIARWDWPHRIWHWAFAIAIAVSSITGYIGGFELMDVHVASGVCVLGLLSFRLVWWFWGSAPVRIRQYRTTPMRLWQQFRGFVPSTAGEHSPAGAAMAIAMFVAVSMQALSGLFASDDIVTEGPYAHLLDESGVHVANAIHTRIYIVIWALAFVHVAAIAAYAVRRDPIAHSMWPVPRTTPPGSQRMLHAGVAAMLITTAIWLMSRWT